jgi:hypothetical protein
MAPQQLEESKTSSSHVELEASASAAFPMMLDFMYSQHSIDVKASADTATALRHLANYFGVPTLFEAVNQFIQKDMCKKNIHFYLEQATLYQDEKVISSTLVVAAWAWEALLVREECSVYMSQLPQSKHLKLLKLVGLEAAKSSRGFRACQQIPIDMRTAKEGVFGSRFV